MAARVEEKKTIFVNFHIDYYFIFVKVIFMSSMKNVIEEAYLTKDI